MGLVNNIAMVLGSREAPYQWIWWIWPSFSPPPGDGLTYGVNKEVQGYSIVRNDLAGDEEMREREVLGEVDASSPDPSSSHVE